MERGRIRRFILGRLCAVKDLDDFRDIHGEIEGAVCNPYRRCIKLVKYENGNHQSDIRFPYDNDESIRTAGLR